VEQDILDRFRDDLGSLVAPDAHIGVAVSGGPDSLALLLLAAAVRPREVEAATIDHALRPGSRSEAETVAGICDRLGVAHSILTARWDEIPGTAIQERARNQRYRLLGYWAEERRLDAIVTAHHADDQAETLLMRLARGAGVKGLAGMRPRAVTPGFHVRLVRPLLGWRHSELEQVCAAAGLTPAADPSNDDERFERVRFRRALESAGELDPAAVARSAANLADADAALEWAATLEWKRAMRERGGIISYQPVDVPAEILRRIVSRILHKLATEGESELRGRELDRLLATLADGGTATLRGVQCQGGREWRFSQAAMRKS
jgi:tRNA(Ile)-lysidine synthase